MIDNKARIIKKYSNRRMYDTKASRHITQDNIKTYVNQGILFRVVDEKSGEDITRSVLLNVILDEEIMGVPLFTEEALRSIILFSGSGMRIAISGFFEQMLPMVQNNQFPQANMMGSIPNQDRIQEQFANLQGMLLGNSFQEYVNSSMKMVGDVNREIAKNTARMMKGSYKATKAKKKTKKAKKK